MKKTRGTLLLLLAAFVWGMAFVAQSAAADSIGAFTFNGTRSILASLFLLAIIALRDRKGKSVQPSGSPWRAGALCGLLLFLAVNLQQFGIAAYPKSTAASGRAGFLTATYVIMVALVAWFLGKKLRPAVIAAAVVCVLGMYMLCLSGGLSGIYTGDGLVLGSAAGFTAYILAVDHFSRLDTLKLSCIQFFVCGMLSLIAMLLFEQPSIAALCSAWLPIFYAGIFSSGVGYTLQMTGQKYAEPAVASIVMSLESVFAALAGWVLLHERLSGHELLGCALVFLAVILAQIPDFVKPDTLSQPRIPNR